MDALFQKCFNFYLNISIVSFFSDINPSDFHLFFDDGGVMNDNMRRGPQWQEEIANYFQPIFGGLKSHWKQANFNAVAAQIQYDIKIRDQDSEVKFDKFIFDSALVWGKTMFNEMSVDIDEETIIFHYNQLEKIVPEKVIADIPGVINILTLLYNLGFNLHTASGESSIMLRGYLKPMGVHSYFKNFFGPDLIGKIKGSKDYYPRILSALDVDLNVAIFIDDSDFALDLINQTGATAIHCNILGSSKSTYPYSFSDYNDFIPLLQNILNVLTN